MADVAVTNTFVDATDAEASEVNTNFTDITTWINANAIRKDGTIAFTAVPSGPNTDPSTDNHLARKKYIDDRNVRISTATFSTQSQLIAEELIADSTIEITDPGYNMDVWGFCATELNPQTAGPTAYDNMWTVRVKVNGTNRSSFTIPIINNGQAASFALRRTTLTTGAGTGTGGDHKIEAFTQRATGTQTAVGVVANGTQSLLEVYYRKR